MNKVFLTSLSVLTVVFGGVCNASADGVCPPGCFCMNGGRTVFAQYQSTTDLCASSSAILQNWSGCVGGSYGDIWVTTNSSCQLGVPASYYFDEFSEFYEGLTGFYGFINNEFVYHNTRPNSNSNVFYDFFLCPLSHPHSDSGASALTQCYKYDANGNKVYYGANTNIVCAEGTYLPANATQCVACNASQNQVCPGGRFEKLDKIQGLRLNCPTGKYLPANATQCSSCDESQYFCFGGIYDYNSTEDQGRIAHNGYVNMGAMHTFITCNPGKYVPANTNQCSACTGDYICPGGIFFTDATYNVDRGKKLCPYGQPNANHTACVGKSSKPSYAREHLSNVINKPAESTSVMKQKIGKNEKVVSVATEKPVADSEETKVSAKDTKKSAEIQNKIDDSKNVKSLTTEKKADLSKENTASKQTVAEEIKASATNTEKTVEVQKDVAGSKKVKSLATEKKLDLGKISAPLAPKFDRALTHRPAPVSANIQETTDINSVVHGTMNEKSEQKRPSRYR